MAKNVAQFMLERLSEWGVRRIYGYPGDGINGLLGAFHEVGDRIEFTQMAHEEIASFAACAHAKFTGEVGVCMEVTWEQRVLAGDPKLEASQNLPDFPFARYAEMLGFKGIRVDNPDDVAPAWEEALSADRPVVYEAITDPEVPPLPPHIRFEQATSFAQAMAKGEPHTLRIAMQSLKGKLQEFTTQ